MQFKILLSDDLHQSSIYDDYSRFIYKRIKRSIKDLCLKKTKNYEIRKDKILSILSLINGEPIKNLNISYYIINCLSLVKIDGIYVIRLTDRKIRGTRIRISFLVRLLEFGTDGLPELPVIRKVLFDYKEMYTNLYYEFMEDMFNL